MHMQSLALSRLSETLSVMQSLQTIAYLFVPIQPQQNSIQVHKVPSTAQWFSLSCLQCRCCGRSCCGPGLFQSRLGHVHVLSVPSGCNPGRNPHRLPSASSCQSDLASYHCDVPGHQCSSCCFWFCHWDWLPAHSGDLPHKGVHPAADAYCPVPFAGISLSWLLLLSPFSNTCYQVSRRGRMSLSACSVDLHLCIVMHLSCTCHALVMHMSCSCHALDMHMSCTCLACVIYVQVCILCP